MSSNNNNYSIRRRLLIISAAYASVTTLASAQGNNQSAQAAAASNTHNAALSTAPSYNSNEDETSTISTMLPTFSCGTHWQSAAQCNQLCIDGNDSSCPTGQYCYAGIPCVNKSNVEDDALRIMEMELMERLIWERDNKSGGVVKSFVSGVSFVEAESSCNRRGAEGDHLSEEEVHYCNSGQSSECPLNMQCYASVACSSGSSSNSGSSSSIPSSLPSAASSSSLSLTQQSQPVVSFSSPTANVTPIIHHEKDDGNDDDASLSYYYSFHNIVGTMGSRLLNSLGALSHS
mmetsp:Transcript_17886/g.28079  ORF Transcript_17886/g.28079 Transcript_17886/m.28079 type:complete len:289 (+) Transcript_17886:143-1009(+)|eukprot:CAMPEP_0201717038 /NCGR_PEP_ID=MMETSP0593-20130828/2877_1 /ASSEMBLY_ACC=CAM_ASM_000672 /TAXON_ID=267983 /ORGANISM="Skeletonema japonicum, Strain CCMP2506" /LENGTH=288 /DNA_ID=CAMNT_0048206997 /DNA_START=67 /DNA_END=933 /DNA_ORIENTATION=-